MYHAIWATRRAAEAERLRVSLLAPGAVTGGLARRWKRFVAPAPPCILAIYVQQKVRHGTPIGTLKADRLPDPGICRFPRFGVLIELIEQAKVLSKQRPEFLECGRSLHGGIEPRKVSAGYDQVGSQFVSPAQTPNLIVGQVPSDLIGLVSGACRTVTGDKRLALSGVSGMRRVAELTLWSGDGCAGVVSGRARAAGRSLHGGW